MRRILPVFPFLTLFMSGCGGSSTSSSPNDAAVDAVSESSVVPDAGCTPWCREVLPKSDAVFKAVWGVSASDVWAVGVDGAIVHYDGARWSPVASPTTKMINSVWGTAQNDVWAVGAEILHYDGTAWTIVPGATTLMTGVWASAKNDAWFVTEKGEVGHWDGSKWTVTPVGSTVFWGVHGTSPSNVWIAASQGKTYRGGVGGFTEVATPATIASESVTSVYAMGDEAWAVGFHQLFMHFTGGAWMLVKEPSGGGKFTWSVSATSATDVWIAGNGAFLQRFDGTKLNWEEPQRGFDGHFTGVFAMPRDVFVVGEGAIFHLKR